MAKQRLYIDCSAGASGDMLLGAALDLLGQYCADPSVPEGEVRPEAAPEIWSRQICGLLEQEHGSRCVLTKVLRAGSPALKVDFYVQHVHADHHASHHSAMTLAGIRHLLDHELAAGRLTAETAGLALRTFEILAAAEAQAHGTTPEKVHFHEVGAFDSIMDVVGFAAAWSLLGGGNAAQGSGAAAAASPVTIGTGTVKCAHGTLPVPTPAVCAIVEAFNLPCTGLPYAGECLTPTGAALLAAVVGRWEETPPERPHLCGCGAGGRNPADHANVLRILR